MKNSLWGKIEREILPFVTKPARYSGNEINSIIKDHGSVDLRIALCFPEMYEIGMSYLGMQILYNLINRRPDCLAERAFAVWPDMEERLRMKNVPLYSLESSTPLTEFDVLGFHLTYEMTYTTALCMLDLSGIPLYSKDRDDSHPLVLAGGPSVMNPEPMADFIDAFFIGEAEETIDSILDTIKDSKKTGLSRIEILKKLSSIPGIYVPGFYKPEYDKSGRFTRINKVEPEAPDYIKYVAARDLKTEYYPEKPIIPFIETIHDHLPVEIMRGCVRGCRFCQAGFQYRPQRQREPREIANQINAIVGETGYEDVTLLSLSSTDYARLSELLTMLAPSMNKRKISIGLPSLRPETLTLSLLEGLSGSRKSGLTLAPEAGTERLRRSLGKNITDDEIYRMVELAASHGYRKIKLYFMIGLPGETDEDIDGIIRLLKELSRRARKGNCDINVTLSPFNPKSHTPWQWARQADMLELRGKIDKITQEFRKPGVKIKYPELGLCILEGVIGRGDRRFSEVLLNAYNAGSRLDGWSEWFDFGRWQEAFDKAGIDIESCLAELDEQAALPWDHIGKGYPKDFLRRENENSKQAIPPKTKFDRKKESLPKQSGEFGRRAKRTPPKSSSIPGTYRLRIRYSRDENLRFLSHLDILRTIYRALRRSGIPLAFSEGYHPHIKTSFGPPLPLGYTSDAEYLDLQLTQPYREEFIEALKKVLPDGMTIMGHKHYFAKPASLSKQLNLARYEIDLGSDYNAESLLENIQRISNSGELVVSRIKAEEIVEIDAGRFIAGLSFENGILLAEIHQTPDGQIKPDEILRFGLGYDDNFAKAALIHRKEQLHKLGERLINPLDLV